MWSRAIALWFESLQVNHGYVKCLTEDLGQIAQTLCASVRSTVIRHTKLKEDFRGTKQAMCLEVCLIHGKPSINICYYYHCRLQL